MYLVFAIILLDLVGFGIMIPILPFYVLNLGGTPGQATLLLGLYSAALVLTTPILGRVSDYFGRKPVILVSLVGAVAAYVILGFAGSILAIAVSRLISGAMAGNISAAQAYITDVTSEKNRASGMALIGMAFGLGFVIGPPLGAWLAGNSFQNANLFLPAMVSAGLSLTALVIAAIFLKESLSPQSREALRAAPRTTRIEALRRSSAIPLLAAIVGLALLYNVAAGLFESLFPIWGDATGVFHTPRDMVPIFLIAGMTMVVVQGGLVRPLSARFSDLTLLTAGLCGGAASISTLIYLSDKQAYWLFAAVMACQAASTALVLTFLQSLVSKRAPDTDRGGVMGVYSSAGMGGRTIGTAMSGGIMESVFIHGPYLIAVTLLAAGAIWVRILARRARALNLNIG